ncbi:MmgE/PrpD family protein [Sulfitobacter aestuariivivens]|uniref:MmgE/PrpD family protein n=1 Tax=Sulfitobacter aestuariivivens TaxID=2766981 RepID=A0A927D3M4_9RHOB|nr:MmgE/PrpD family protein [Sulfitobacter aestuariivivens]MBD3664545.1 MmgE/PrpD family protein [Sulfitobacter aestuariivivens]
MLPQKISQFILDMGPGDMPAETLERAALLMLDTLGIAIAAGPMEAGILARETACRLYGTDRDKDRAWMMCDGRSASLAGAAFAIASQTDNLDGHDGFNPTKGHIGVAVVPALIALAQHLPHLSGRDALAALVVGYEVAGRAGLALHNTVSDYHTSGAWNALGVAALSARVREASSAHLREALGIAEYHGPRSQMMREIANPTMLHDGSGMGAMVGISATIMAELGFTGAPAITVESDDVAAYWADLGSVWQTQQQYIKPYPICRWAHAPIDAAQKICTEHGVTHEMVERIEIRSFPNAVALFPEMPETTSQAQYSLAFAVGCMIRHGNIGLDQISGAGLQDRDVAALVSRTHLKVDARHTARFPSGRWADMTMTLKDGRALSSGDINARGGPDDPFSEAMIVDKYRSFAVPVLGSARADAIAQACLAMTQPEVSFNTLLTLLKDPAEAQLAAQ